MLITHRNRTLFSNNYLEKLLPQENEWKVEVEHVFKRIKELWDSERSGLPSLNKSQLRRHFLDKVFDILGFTTDVEPPVVGEGWAKKPEEICAPPYNGVLFNSGKIFRLEGHTVHLFEKNM